MADTSMTNSISSAVFGQNDGQAVNPKSILGKDDFLKLLLTELEYQDPTDPMDTEKILAQTSELATLEAQQNTNKTLEKLIEGFEMSSALSAVSAIGKFAKMGNKIKVEKGAETSFTINFEQPVKSGTIKIYSEAGEVVKTISIPEGSNGNTTFRWDGKDESGNQVQEGFYKVSGDYVDKNGGRHNVEFGTFPIEGVSFENGKALLKIGGQYVPMMNVAEIFSKEG